jgi:histidinol-phosphate/aromatic aminotransferase/cobyric acid decarboxylase-like protein
MKTSRTASRPFDLDMAVAYVPRRRNPAIDLYLDANEGRPFPATLAAIVQDIAAGSVGRYPSFADLEAAIARKWDVDPARVLVTAGGDESIARVSAARLAAGARSIVYEPAFEMFGAYARGRGADVLGLSWTDDFPLAGSLEQIQDNPAVALVCLASPSNPLGLVVSRAEVMALADACAATGTGFLFDAAYGEFASDDPSPALLARGDTYVTRTFSKAYGLAGLRMGYVISPNAAEAGLLRSLGSPYPSSGLGAHAALTALADTAGLEAAISRVKAERAGLTAALKARGLSPSASEANFVFFRAGTVLDACGGAAGFAAAMADRGIAVRSFANRPGLQDSIRISCPGDEGAFGRVLAAIDAILPVAGKGAAS